MAAVVDKRSLLDEKMSDVYDWSDSDLPVRDALWIISWKHQIITLIRLKQKSNLTMI